MSTTTTERKKKESKQIQFDFGLARTPEHIRLDNKEERGKIHYLLPKDKVEDKKVPAGSFFFKQTFFNVDFRYRHNGFNEIARQAGVNLKNLEAGNVVVFFNTARTQFILAFSDKTILHHNNGTQRVETRAMDDVIRGVLRTGKLNYDDGLSEFLKRRGHGVDEEKIKNSKLN